MFNYQKLDLTTLGRAAAIVRQRCHIDNLDNLDTSTMYGTDCRLTSIARTFHICLDLAKTKIVSYLCAVLTSHLSCVRSVLLRTTETHLTS